MAATLLPIPDDPRFLHVVKLWTDGWYEPYVFPRSVWIRDFENLLREFYPSANSDSLTLTARHAAPFPLALGPNVP